MFRIKNNPALFQAWKSRILPHYPPFDITYSLQMQKEVVTSIEDGTETCYRETPGGTKFENVVHESILLLNYMYVSKNWPTEKNINISMVPFRA